MAVVFEKVFIILLGGFELCFHPNLTSALLCEPVTLTLLGCKRLTVSTEMNQTDGEENEGTKVMGYL